MRLVVLATDEQWEELAMPATGVEWIKAAVPFTFTDYDADAFFILDTITGINYSQTHKPVFINADACSHETAQNIIYINGWVSFLQCPVWEAAGNLTDQAADILNKLNKKIIMLPDNTCFISNKTVAMIINEAYFALGDEVSDKTSIDAAMKMGTNYPYGPFEWAQKIGVKNIYSFLKQLSKTDRRYTPAPALAKEATA
jgi:3-hydroxybutyryl-CoA dehydrogenase